MPGVILLFAGVWGVSLLPPPTAGDTRLGVPFLDVDADEEFVVG